MARRLDVGVKRRRSACAAAVVLGVIAIHGCVVERLRDRMAELGAMEAAPARFKVAYVRELEFARPVVARLSPIAPVATAKPRRLPTMAPLGVATAAAASAASAAEPATEASSASEPASAPQAAASDASSIADAPAASVPAPSAAASVPDAAVAAVDAASAASTASDVDVAWPQSTRVDYILEGNYRGEIHGVAQVEWARAGADRYQVHLDVTVGLAFAPLLTRSMNSEGRITPEGLSPERFDQDSKVAFRDRQRGSQRFEAGQVVMFDGQRLPRPPGMQDTTSQFIQLAWLFTRHPELMQPGASVELPLVLPRRIARYVYDVIGTEPVYTRFGSIDAVHLKPRRAEPTPGELAVEIWFAPSLRNLPVRIKLRQDEGTFIDLVIARKPELGS